MKKKYLIQVNNWTCINIIFFLVSIDILSKNWIINHVQLNETKKVFSLLNILYVRNYGAVFSLFAEQSTCKRWILCAISFVTILIMTLILLKTSNKYEEKKISYMLIIAGAIGNLINRISYGFVIDFIDLHFSEWHFATFNIADGSILLGIFIFTQINDDD